MGKTLANHNSEVVDKSNNNIEETNEHSDSFTEMKKETLPEKPRKEESKANDEIKTENSPEQKKLDKLPEPEPGTKPTQTTQNTTSDEERNTASKQNEESNTNGLAEGSNALNSDKLTIPGLVKRKESLEPTSADAMSPSVDGTDVAVQKLKLGSLPRVHPKLEGSPMKLILHVKTPNSQLQNKKNEGFSGTVQSDLTQDVSRLLVSNQAVYNSNRLKESKSELKATPEYEIPRGHSVSPVFQTTPFLDEEKPLLYLENRRSAPTNSAFGTPDDLIEKRRGSVSSVNSSTIVESPSQDHEDEKVTTYLFLLLK